MRIAVDTNRYSDYMRQVPEAIEPIRRAERIFLPFVVVAELRAGFLSGGRSAANEAALVRFLGSSRVEILFADEDTAHHFARLFRQLRVQRTPVPIHDVWIAALCLQHDLHLLSRDAHFDRLPQIPRV